ncbi:MAG TPA: hypothetical protein PLV23_09590 [Sedimentibacter sp.]|nr:hypothetical protein [Sedimentibacter sp.]NMB98339.1 hypothetical protein [Clostridiaceae bacterium]HHZ00487.1 hypothetical protein [Tissierellia bacterium]HOK49396.1 hypothetical protein [Sedimentibacter sp.]HOW23865.1 hypothetical protein [Sedimentibacter sp.]
MQEFIKANSINEITEGLPKDTVVGEFAGRDSVAAIIKALEDDSIDKVLPVASFSPTEYGDFKSLESNYHMMVVRIRDLYGDNKHIFPLVYYSNFDLWSVINGRLLTTILNKFGFYSPCIGCHAYLHLLRTLIAVKLGKKVICGEREIHDGRIKINQASHSIDKYIKIVRHFNVELLTPLRHMEDGSQVEKLLGWDWKEGKGHQSCAFSGNYSDIKGNVKYDENKLKSYLDNYIYPVCTSLGEVLLQNEHATKIDMMDKLASLTL